MWCLAVVGMLCGCWYAVWLLVSCADADVLLGFWRYAWLMADCMVVGVSFVFNVSFGETETKQADTRRPYVCIHV